MSNNLDNEIKKQLSLIKGKLFRYIGRAGDLVWLGFGKDVVFKNYRGIERKTAQYSLHIQCPFRISCNGKKKIGSGDMYETNSITRRSSDFNQDETNTNIYDEKALILTQELKHFDVTVINIESNVK